MRAALNQHIRFDAIARWWDLLVVGPGVGLVFSSVTDFRPIRPLRKASPDAREYVSVVHPGWKDDMLYTVLGLLLAIGLVWLLEEIRANS